MLYVAGIEPVWSEFAIPLGGVALFAAMIAFGQRRPTRVGSLVVLTLLLGLWLFGEGLVWRKRWPSMLRGTQTWANSPGAWEWTGMLLLTYAAVAAIAASLRLFSSGRQRAGWACAFLSVALFTAWSAVVNYSPALALVSAAIAVAAILGDARLRHSPATSTVELHARDRSTRVLTVTAVTLAVAFWVILALFWFVFREGDNYCDCWADQHDAWQYSAQLLVALAGGLGIAVIAGAWLSRNRDLLVVGGIVAVSALGGWIAFYSSGAPHPDPEAVHVTLPDVSGPTPQLAQTSAGCPMPVEPLGGIAPGDPRSLYLATNFAHVLAIIRAHHGPNPTIQALQLSLDGAQFQDLRGEHQWRGEVMPDGRYAENVTGLYRGPKLGFHLSQLSVDVPSALSTRIAMDARMPVGELWHMEAIAASNQQHFYWIVFANSPRWEFFRATGASGSFQGFGPCGDQTFR